jgi:DNA-binding IclR family transcriptional regulator
MEKNLDNSNEKKKPGSEGRIQSLERAFAVLEETARHKNGISLSDLSRKLNLHTSTLYHLTKTLTSLGYLGMGDNKRYRVGRSIYQLASKCFDDIDLTATCQPFLERLAFETGESSHFAVWEKKNVFLMSRVSGTNSLQLNEGAGTMRPVHCTAIGKVLLTGFPPEEFEAILHDIEFEQFTANTLTSPEELRAQVEKARIEGVALAHVPGRHGQIYSGDEIHRPGPVDRTRLYHRRKRRRIELPSIRRTTHVIQESSKQDRGHYRGKSGYRPCNRHEARG